MRVYARNFYWYVVISVWLPPRFLKYPQGSYSLHSSHIIKPTQTQKRSWRYSGTKKLWNIPNFTNLWYEVRRKKEKWNFLCFNNQLHCNPSQKRSSKHYFMPKNYSLSFLSIYMNFINFRNKLFHSIVCYVYPSDEMMNEYAAKIVQLGMILNWNIFILTGNLSSWLLNFKCD